MTTKHRTQLVSLLVITCCLFGFTASSRCQAYNFGGIGPSKGEVIGASVGAAAVITAAIVIPVVIIHKHHNIKGCVLTADSGLQLRQGDAKTFALTGVTTYVKPGELVSLHGAKAKTHKGSSDAPSFLVDGVTRDFGPCKLPPPNTGLASTP